MNGATSPLSCTTPIIPHMQYFLMVVELASLHYNPSKKEFVLR
jgi:hypothetical protein